jgi:serine protease Do
MKKVLITALVLLIAQITIAQSLPELYNKVNSSVVVIQTMTRTSAGAGDKQKVNTESGLGSGVLITEDGYIWTAAHVVQLAEYVVLKFTDDDVYEAKIISSDPLSDVALIKIEGDFKLKNKHVAKVGDSDAVNIGEDIFVIGAPRGLEQTLSKGIVSGRLKPEQQGFTPVEYIQTDASINPGNSGGPMFNMKGEVIAIASFILTESGGFNGIGFGATSNVATKVLMEQEAIWSGAEYVYIDGDMASAFNLPQTAGMLITSVSQGGIIQKLGLRGGFINAVIEDSELLIGGDVILSIAGIEINDPAIAGKLREKIFTLGSGETYTVKYYRQGQVRNAFVIKD